MRWAIAAGVTLVLAGCGGSSKGTAKPSRGFGFQARVERICRARSARYSSTHLPSLDEIARARARMAQELSLLQPPKALVTGYRRFVALMAHEAALMRRFARYAREDNLTALLAPRRELHDTNKLPRQALLLGLANCA